MEELLEELKQIQASADQTLEEIETIADTEMDPIEKLTEITRVLKAMNHYTGRALEIAATIQKAHKKAMSKA